MFVLWTTEDCQLINKNILKIRRKFKLAQNEEKRRQVDFFKTTDC